MENTTEEQARLLLKDVLTCNYGPATRGENLLNYLAKSGYKVWALHNIRLRNVCESLKNKNELCYDPVYVSQICRLHHIQLVKTVRMRVHQVEDLLDEENLNLKIIVLFRDPRAVRCYNQWDG